MVITHSCYLMMMIDECLYNKCKIQIVIMKLFKIIKSINQYLAIHLSEYVISIGIKFDCDTCYYIFI